MTVLTRARARDTLVAVNIVLFDKDEIAAPLSLDDGRAAHVLNVLRKGVGDSFEAGVIGGMAGTARIAAIDRPQKKMYLAFTPLSDGRPLHPVEAIIGFPRPIQLRRIFRDMAGLGVGGIRLAGTELGEKSYMRSTMFERGADGRSAAEKMLIDGCAQAKSTRVPKLFLHETLESCVEEAVASDGRALRVALDNVAPETSLLKARGGLGAQPPGEGGMAKTREGLSLGGRLSPSVVLAVGNERGWTDGERGIFRRAGFLLCGMGGRVLRTETAACAAVALVLGAMGVLEDG
jgi:RsmE family RNA methyltransferase